MQSMSSANLSPELMKTGNRVWLYIVAVMLLPGIVLIFQDNTLFPPSAMIDTWFYLGFFRHLVNFKRDLFPDTYYGSRLSWILPGYVVHSVLPAAAASCVLHLGVIWVSLLSLFTTLRFTMGVRCAFLTTLVASANPQLWSAIGWDYTDGAAVAYGLLTMALFTRSAVRPRPTWGLLFAGMSLAGLVYVNLFWAAIAPLPVLYYLALAWQRTGVPPQRLLPRLAIWCGTGFVLVTVVLCSINYAIDGKFWFYGPSLHAAGRIVRNNASYQSPWRKQGLAPWLWIVVVTVTGALLSLAPSRIKAAVRGAENPAPVLFSLLAVAGTVLFLYLQFQSHLAVLGLFFYADGLFPFVFLAAGCLFFAQADGLSNRSFTLLCGSAAVILALVWADYNEKWLPIWPDDIWPAAVVIGVLFAGALVIRRPVAATALALAAFTCLTAEVRRMRSDLPLPIIGPHTHRDTFQRVMDVSARIDEVRQNRPVRFWFDREEPTSDDYLSVNALYLERYTRLQPDFGPPSCTPPVNAGTIVVASSIRPDVANRARAALAGCANIQGLRFALASSFTTLSPAGRYTTAILTTEMDAQRWHTLKLSSIAPVSDAHLSAYTESGATLPGNRWTALYPDLGTRIAPNHEGLLVRTGNKPHTDAASFGPIVIPASGRYGFSLRVIRRAGEFVFGVAAGSEANWVASIPSGDTRSVNDLECWSQLEQGQRIWLRIANGKTTNAEFIIREVRAYQLEPTR
jgi:hypothetical protein